MRSQSTFVLGDHLSTLSRPILRLCVGLALTLTTACDYGQEDDQDGGSTAGAMGGEVAAGSTAGMTGGGSQGGTSAGEMGA